MLSKRMNQKKKRKIKILVNALAFIVVADIFMCIILKNLIPDEQKKLRTDTLLHPPKYSGQNQKYKKSSQSFDRSFLYTLKYDVPEHNIKNRSDNSLTQNQRKSIPLLVAGDNTITAAKEKPYFRNTAKNTSRSLSKNSKKHHFKVSNDAQSNMKTIKDSKLRQNASKQFEAKLNSSNRAGNITKFLGHVEVNPKSSNNFRRTLNKSNKFRRTLNKSNNFMKNVNTYNNSGSDLSKNNFSEAIPTDFKPLEAILSISNNSESILNTSNNFKDIQTLSKKMEASPEEQINNVLSKDYLSYMVTNKTNPKAKSKHQRNEQHFILHRYFTRKIPLKKEKNQRNGFVGILNSSSHRKIKLPELQPQSKNPNIPGIRTNKDRDGFKESVHNFTDIYQYTTVETVGKIKNASHSSSLKKHSQTNRYPDPLLEKYIEPFEGSTIPPTQFSIPRYQPYMGKESAEKCPGGTYSSEYCIQFGEQIRSYNSVRSCADFFPSSAESYNWISSSDSVDTVLVKCCNRQPKLKVQSRHGFKVLQNFLPSQETFVCNSSVTLTTHSDVRFLDNLKTVMDRWTGPVSVAVYVTEDNVNITLDVLKDLRQNHEEIEKKCAFHLFFEETLNLDLKVLWKYYADRRSKDRNSVRKYKRKEGTHYPISVARNIARYAATTYYVLAADIELYPSEGLEVLFWKFLERNPEYLAPIRSQVFVLPSFEIKNGVDPPRNKIGLVKLINSGHARTFHKEVCPQCHVIPDQSGWIKHAYDSNTLGVFKTIRRGKRGVRYWEPVYIGTQMEPPFDDRLTWEGMRDKQMQGFAMCLLSYDYHILDNAFMVHRPGIKVHVHLSGPQRRTMLRQKLTIASRIAREYINRYGKNKYCRM